MRNDPQPSPEQSRQDESAAAATPAQNAALSQGLSRPTGVYVIAAVVAVEALAMAAIAVWAIFSAFGTPMASMASGIFLIVLLLGLAAGLAGVAVNVFKGMRWTRSAAFVWQLMMVAVGTPALLEGNVLLGLAMMMPAIAAACFLFTPKVVAFSQRTAAETEVL